jgi:hypothetical protein
MMNVDEQRELNRRSTVKLMKKDEENNEKDILKVIDSNERRH